MQNVKHVLRFATLIKYRGPSDSSRSLIISPVPHAANVIYCITCTLCQSYASAKQGEELRGLEHLRDVEKDDKNASKPAERHLNLPSHSKQHMGGLRPFPTSRKHGKPQNSRKKIIFQIGTLNPHGINGCFSFNYFILFFFFFTLPCTNQ